MDEEHFTADLEARVRRVISEALSVDPETLHLARPITLEDGLVGGLDLVQAKMAIQEEFQFSIPDDDMDHLLTLGEFTDYIHSRLTGQALPWARTGHQHPLTSSASPSNQGAHSSPAKVGRKKKETPAITKTENTHTRIPSHAWKFDLGRWEATEDTVYQGSSERGFVFEEALQRLQYHAKPALVMGTHEQGMCVEVYSRAHKESAPSHFAYYLKLWVGQDIESIYITNLPSLITFLSRLGTIVGNTQVPS